MPKYLIIQEITIGECETCERGKDFCHDAPYSQDQTWISEVEADGPGKAFAEFLRLCYPEYSSGNYNAEWLLSFEGSGRIIKNIRILEVVNEDPQAHAKFLAWVKYKGQRYEKQKVKLQRKQDEAKFEELAKKLGKNVVETDDDE